MHTISAKPTNTLFASLILAALMAGLSGCSNDADSNNQVLTPIAFEASDECHLCGMAITPFPGPKGELFEGRQNQVRKFCSTLDLMSWYLQPENKPNSHALYVHNMANTDWNAPEDKHLIPAETAWFIIGSSKTGAMGPTLASFAAEAEAQKFAAEFGGRLVRFDEITLNTLN